MSENLRIWDALGRTDPSHTKGFNRAGGFKGTAIKPIYIQKRLTEQFGPCGIGWGMGEPSFQVVQADGEILVYCTVRCWHTDPQHALWGVGGDKVQTKRSNGAFNDDEAFKKAFTDAVGNAFKSIGVGADVHMGQFDDDKYVTARKAEVAQEALAGEMLESERTALAKLNEVKDNARLTIWFEDNKPVIDSADEASKAILRAAYSAKLKQYPNPKPRANGIDVTSQPLN